MTDNHLTLVSTPPARFERQLRLRVGPLLLVLAAPAAGSSRGMAWALPGGGSANYGELVRLARARGWRRPELVAAHIRHRLDDAEAHGIEVVDIPAPPIPAEAT